MLFRSGKTEEALSQAAEGYGAKGATAIVMNPNTGEVLAMANWPGFDPSDLQDATPDELENRATGFTYEPGSTFKAFTVASALSDHVVTPHSSFYLPPEIRVYDRTIGESHPRGPVTLTTAQILAQSSNVGAVTIGEREGASRFSQWINRFGFGQPTDLGFPGEERGIVPELKDYSGSTMGNLPIGQGLAVTPIQIATAYAAIADGGILRRLLTEMGPVRAAKTIVRTFPIDADCHQISAILVNDVTACTPGEPGACLDGLALSSRVKTLRFYK